MGRASVVAALVHKRPGALDLDWVRLHRRLCGFVPGCRHALMRGGVIPDLALRFFTAPGRRGGKGLGGDVDPKLVNWTASALPFPALDIRLGVEQPLLLTWEDWRDCPSAGHQLNCPMHSAASALFSFAAGAQRQRGSTASADTLGWQERACCSSQRRSTIHNRSPPRAGLPGFWCAWLLRILHVVRRQRRGGA